MKEKIFYAGGINLNMRKKVIKGISISLIFFITLFFFNIPINQAQQSINSAFKKTITAMNDDQNNNELRVTVQLNKIRVSKGDTVELFVDVTGGSGNYSYQWFENTTNSTSGGSEISKTPGTSYQFIKNEAGTYYYYVIVEDIDNNETAISNIVELTVEEPQPTIVNAQEPKIKKQPENITVTIGTMVFLEVEVEPITDGGNLSYQWYRSTNNSIEGGKPISGATKYRYQVPTSDKPGTSYYYVVVTNTNNAATQNKTATDISHVVAVTVNPIVDAAQPNISTQPKALTVNKGEVATLTVGASIKDNGTLSYQWYRNTANSNSGGEAIPGATGASYNVPTDQEGTHYYYVVVTNTNENATGTKTASVTSSAAAVTVKPIVNAEQPKITSQPEGKTVTKGDKLTLSVTASVSDKGTLSYQWYKNTTDSISGGSSISGATKASFDVPTSDEGTYYYYVVVTNTNNNASGSKTASVTSNVVKVTVNSPQAEQPKITKQPEGKTVNKGEKLTLSVTASVSDKGTLSYQWYKNTKNSTSGGTEISGATKASYDVPTDEVGTFYYYVVVTNTNNNLSSGNKTASTTSNVVTVTVNASQAEQPTITKQPEGTTVDLGKNVILTVSATVKDNGTLSYQWYRNTTNSTNGGTAINGATSPNYQVPTNVEGTFYYYVIVTNTNNAVSGTKTATVTSNVVSVTVKGTDLKDDLLTPGIVISPSPLYNGTTNLHGLDIVGHWAANDIMKLANYRLISGYPDGSFRPDNIITRAEFTAIIVRALGLNPWEAKEFSDTRNHWAKGVISTAYVHGIISGYSESHFGPDDPITREQMAAIIANAFDLQHGVGKKFTDHNQISPWAVQAVEIVAGYEIIRGYEDGSFRPKNYATRAEASAVISRILE